MVALRSSRSARAALCLAAALAGCAGDDASLDDLEIGCVALDRPATFKTSADFAPAVGGTLAGWVPDGRWFLTGARISANSSLHFIRLGPRVIIDRDYEAPARIDDTEIFQRISHSDESGNEIVTATRVSNRRPDGTARAERAMCVSGNCSVCTAKLIPATHNADEGEGEGLTLLGELGATWDPTYTLNVRVAGTLAYVIRRDGLHIVETRDPAHPVELGHYHRGGQGYANDVKVVDAGPRRYALIADSPIDVVDVTSPSAPFLAAQITESAHTLFTETRGEATRAYLGNYDGRCAVYDVTEPTAPRKLGAYDAGATLIHDLSVVNGIAYLNAWERGFLVVDLTAPEAPRLLGSWTSTPTHTSHSNWTTTAGGRRIALHGEEAYDAHLNVVDIEPASSTYMAPFASWQTRPWISIHNIMAFGTKAYLTHYQDGVRVLDLSDPAHPAQLGYYNTWDPQADYATSAFYEGAVGLDVDLVRKLVFVADSPRGLLILRDDTP
ncbi:MAG TPA: hypothetical protein VGD80_24415 [Kofleriaceae bacterium]